MKTADETSSDEEENPFVDIKRGKKIKQLLYNTHMNALGRLNMVSLFDCLRAPRPSDEGRKFADVLFNRD